MPDIIFSHPEVNPSRLVINIGPNEFTWGYGLNTQSFPTYGGEVVQILSAYTDDVTVAGEVGTYKKMEEIYTFFVGYMTVASQPTYSQIPVQMDYPERGWTLMIQPKSLPEFRYGTEVVAPTWRVISQVVEEDPNMAEVTLANAVVNDFDFAQLHAGVGYDIENPFTDPAAHQNDYNPQELLSGYADYYNNLIDAYNQGDFSSVLQGFYGTGSIGSKPADAAPTGNQTTIKNPQQQGGVN